MSTGVLIVDDSHFMRNLLRQILQRDYHIVGEAENGAKAVKMYKEHDPDVVMMDIVMPKANGIKATAAIKKIDPDAKVIMCTSVGQREKMKLAVKAGADGYVTKPFEEESVRKALTDVVESEPSAV